MDTSYIIIGPLFGLLGVVIGAILHSLLSRRNDENRSLTELRNAAYADFLNAASQIAVAQRRGHREHVSVQLAALADAKARICVYGHSNVVKALAKFLRHGGTLQTEPEILAFTKLCLEIRTSAGMKRKELYSSDISQLLFSVDVKNVETPKWFTWGWLVEPFGSFLGAAGSVASLASLVAIWRGERSGLLRLALGTIFLLAGFSSYSSYVYYEETKPAAVRQARQVELREAVQKFLSDNSAVPSNIDSGHNYGIVQGGLILLELYKDVIPDSYKHFRDEAHESISFGKSHMDAAAQAKSSSIAAQSMLTTLRLVAGGG